MGSLKIRRDDTVEVISGKDKGKTGKVLRVEPKKNRVFVEGMNMTTRHRRARGMAQQASTEGVTHQEGPIHISNVMLVDPKTNQPTRVKMSREGGQRQRIAKKSGESID
jgi:large subunit ribosomal protein L24